MSSLPASFVMSFVSLSQAVINPDRDMMRWIAERKVKNLENGIKTGRFKPEVVAYIAAENKRGEIMHMALPHICHSYNCSFILTAALKNQLGDLKPYLARFQNIEEAGEACVVYTNYQNFIWVYPLLNDKQRQHIHALATDRKATRFLKFMDHYRDPPPPCFDLSQRIYLQRVNVEILQREIEFYQRLFRV
jgi:hypothetical protein